MTTRPDIKRLEGLRVANLNLAVECDWCSHRGVLRGPDLWRYFAVRVWRSEWERLGEHIRCSVCKRRPSTFVATDDPPTIHPFPRDEQSWQRLVRLLRG